MHPAAEWYEKASAAQRSVFPFTSAGEGNVDLDACKRVREIEESVRRADPSAPDRLKGRLTLKLDATALGVPAGKVPHEWRPSLQLSLRDQKLEWTAATSIGQVFDEHGMVTMGVAEGTYALWILEGEPQETEPLGRDKARPYGPSLWEVPEVIGVKGEVTLRVRLVKLGEIVPKAPVGGASLTGKAGALSWPPVDGAKSYRVWVETCDKDGQQTDLVWGMGWEEKDPHAWLSEGVGRAGAGEVDRLKGYLDKGAAMRWCVDALDAKDHRIATSGVLLPLQLAPTPKGK